MLEKTPYTPGMRDVFKLARQEAGRLGHDYVGPEHYLLGIIRKEDGLAVQVLLNLEVDLEALKNRMEELLKQRRPPIVGLFSSNQEAKRILDEAREGAQRMEQSWVGTEHLLLALILAHDTIPGIALKEAGVIAEKATAEAVRLNVEIDRDQSCLGKEVFPPYSSGMLELSRLAEQEAKSLGSEQVGPEHLLLGVIQLNNGLAFQAIYSMQVDLEQLRRDLLHGLKTGSPGEGACEPSEKALEVLDRAGKFAAEEKSRFIFTHHLLLALLANDESLPAKLLRELDVSPKKVTEIVGATAQMLETEFGTVSKVIFGRNCQ